MLLVASKSTYVGPQKKWMDKRRGGEAVDVRTLTVSRVR